MNECYLCTQNLQITFFRRFTTNFILFVPVTTHGFYFFTIHHHHCTNSHSLMHIFAHHCTFCESLHVKTSPAFNWCLSLYSFILDISIAPLQVHYYSEALPTQHTNTVLQFHAEAPQASKGLVQGPCVAARAGFKPTTLRTKGN